MPIQAPEVLLVLLLTVLFPGLRVEQTRFSNHPTPPRASRRGSWPLPPDDCQLCRDTTNAPLTTLARPGVPYAQRKSYRGPFREKTIDTRGRPYQRKLSARRYTRLYRLRSPAASASTSGCEQ